MKMRRSCALAVGLMSIGLMGIAACGSAATDPGPRAETAPGAAGEGEAALQWSAPPAMEIDPSKTYEAVLMTEIGEIQVRLFAEQTPVTVNNFVFLARQGYYDNTTFHRVLPDFMAQGGDPTGTGTGGPGYTFDDEFHPDLRFDRGGLLAMANRGPGTNGSQFFITFAPTPHLTGLHTIFGELVEGMDVLANLRLRDPLDNPDFPGDGLVSIEIIEVDE